MTRVDVNEYVESAMDTEALQRAQIKSAGTIIAQFLLVREGLTGRIPDNELNATAATLTAGIWASSDT
jgi:hypothetical protein